MEHKSSWVEIKVAVLPAEADAVANFLIELGSNGIVEESNNLSPALPRKENILLLKAYVNNDANLNNYIDSINKYLISLRSMESALVNQEPELLVTEIEDEDWNEKWKSFFQPIKVTKNIVIKPSWRNYWKQENEIVIELDPGMAFGTGTHASTRLCLQALENLIEDSPDIENVSLLDVGTGSGILAIAAALLGIQQVVGIDIDLQAVACAKKNAAVNVAAEQVLFESTPLHKIPGSFSIVVANILPQTLIDMKDDLMGHLKPSGYLILSGIIQERARDVIDAFKSELVFKKETQDEEWSCLLFQNKTC
jgi:ribosomal protein L11 methyltransferase